MTFTIGRGNDIVSLFFFFFFGDPVARGLRLRPPWDVRVVESDLLRLLLEEREKIGTKNG